ncbi:histidine phosphatase superfamily [Pelagophyceae sp. CCMP2097]|nr:histidine phosphatase superfamily [Pelagophyceae sp. CCMP2097]
MNGVLRRGAWLGGAVAGGAVFGRRALCDGPPPVEDRPLFRPVQPYPHWDKDWDGLDDKARRGAPTRHIILIRHGQYEEASKDDELRVLTPLGRAQALATGARLADLLAGASPDAPIRVRVSTMQRARETREVLAPLLPSRAVLEEPEKRLEEGRPSHAIPGHAFSARTVEVDGAPARGGLCSPLPTRRPLAKRPLTHRAGARIESAFRSIFKRGTQGEHKHEYDIIVCHGNVIRYMSMRALQLPPEAWLRLCTFNCSISYFIVRPSGSVSMRTMGDVGHLEASKLSFSGHHGLEW